MPVYQFWWNLASDPVEPGGPDRDPVCIVARVKLHMCTNFGEIWPLTWWEPGGTQRTGSDSVCIVARVKLHMCTNIGGIWPLTRWEPGGTRRTGSGSSLYCSPCQTTHVYKFWWNLASDPVGTRWNPEDQIGIRSVL